MPFESNRSALRIIRELEQEDLDALKIRQEDPGAFMQDTFAALNAAEKIMGTTAPRLRLFIRALMHIADVADGAVRLMISYSEKKARIHKPAGSLLQTVLSAVFPKKYYDLHFAQIIADMRDEANDLDSQGRTTKRRWIVFCYHLAATFTCFAFVFFSIIKRLKLMWTTL